MTARAEITAARRWVVKIGSSMVTAQGQGLDRAAIAAWVAQIASLRKSGIEVVLVSSGAVAEGMARLGHKNRPRLLHALQATAAVGQMGLIQAWETAFQVHGLRTAQVLLTHEDVADRQRYLNASSTLRTLLDFGVVPVINENDTVATEEIRVGDNDTLAALAANLLEAQLLVILTDQDGIHEADPRQQPKAPRIADALLTDPRLDQVAGEGRGELGRGGMRTKLLAARWAARSGASTVIAHGGADQVLRKIADGVDIGTCLRPAQGAMAARKRWIAGQLQVSGTLHLDAGAVAALRQQGKSLLPVGVLRIEGKFGRGDLVRCAGPDGAEVARGLSNYSAEDAEKILGKPTSDLEAALGAPAEAELIHRDNLVLPG